MTGRANGEKQLELEQAPLPELPEAQLIYRNQENQSGSLPMDRSSDQDQTPSQRDRLEQFFADDGSRKISAGGTKNYK